MALNTNGILTDPSRGAEPSDWEHSTVTPVVTFTWHHTIPWNCLAAVWNGLVAGQHWAAVETFLRLVSAQDPAGAVRQIRSGTLMDRDRLHTQLTWQGWNIVEGPGGDFREGDPGEGYDKWSIQGLSNNQRSTVQAVDQLYMAMRPLAARPPRPGFATNVPNLSANEAKAVEKAMAQQMAALRGKPPMLWNPDAWEVVREGQADRKLPSLWRTPPIWRKRA